MDHEDQDIQMHAYSQAVRSGLYDKRAGPRRKYDNVRLYWEDRTTGQALLPYLQKVILRCKSQIRRVRIMDLGCGSADGFELLSSIAHIEPSLDADEVDLLTPNALGLYKGIDLNKDLLEQARAIYGKNPKMVFEQADFTQGLPMAKEEKPYDLYFTSYGTCSHHNRDDTLIRVLVDIVRRTEDYCIIVCDWLGRFSYEWQTLWTNDLSKNRNMDYIVSYIYDREEREKRSDQLQHLTLRLMSRQEAESITVRASRRAGVEIKPLVYFDRSVFTGRHMDTGEYNPHAQPIRQAVNSLHQDNLRTDLSSLIVNYVPKPGFDLLNDYFEHLQMCWNTLVQYTQHLLEAYDLKEQRFPSDVDGVPATYPPRLREMMERMKRVVEGVGWLGIGMPRENIIEPQLGYALRHLVNGLQDGQGCAHSLVGIFEVTKGVARSGF